MKLRALTIVFAVASMLLVATSASATVIALAHGGDKGYKPKVELTATNPVQATSASINAFMTGKPERFRVVFTWSWSCTDSSGGVTTGDGHRHGNNLFGYGQPLAFVQTGSTCTVDFKAAVRIHNDADVWKAIKVTLNLKTTAS